MYTLERSFMRVSTFGAGCKILQYFWKQCPAISLYQQSTLLTNLYYTSILTNANNSGDIILINEA